MVRTRRTATTTNQNPNNILKAGRRRWRINLSITFAMEETVKGENALKSPPKESAAAIQNNNNIAQSKSQSQQKKETCPTSSTLGSKTSKDACITKTSKNTTKPPAIDTILKKLQRINVQALPLGTFVNMRILKCYASSSTTPGRKRKRDQKTTTHNNHGDDVAMYLGTIVSYSIPPLTNTTSTNKGTKQQKSNIVGNNQKPPKDYGLYHVEFIDGDSCDLDPYETWEGVQLYNQQQQLSKKERYGHIVLGNKKFIKQQQEVQDPNKKRKQSHGLQILDLELVLFYKWYEQFFKETQKLTSCQQWANTIGWKNLGDDATATITTMGAALDRILQRQQLKRPRSTLPSCAPPTNSNLWMYPIKSQSMARMMLSPSQQQQQQSTVSSETPESQVALDANEEEQATPTQQKQQQSSVVGAFAAPSLSHELDKQHPPPIRILTFDDNIIEGFAKSLDDDNDNGNDDDNNDDHFREYHELKLSVDQSYIPNAGRGLFVEYCGPAEQWIVPNYIDLGTYGPHQKEDIKSSIVMEVKNFLFQNKPSEWSFGGPPEDKGGGDCRHHHPTKKNLSASSSSSDLISNSARREKQQKQHNLYGKHVDQHDYYDITSDKTGDVHHLAEQSLLPFVNEVVLPKNGVTTAMAVTSSSSITTQQEGTAGAAQHRIKQTLDIQNVESAHHNDGSVHYLLRAGTTLVRGEKVELLVDYGPEYHGVRESKSDYDYNHKNTATATATTCTPILSTNNNDGDCVEIKVGSDDTTATSEITTTTNGDKTKSNMTGQDDNDKAHEDDIDGKKQTPRQFRHLKPNKTKVVGMSYRSMYDTITTYTETELQEVLDYFLETPPLPSIGRRRMIWVVEQAALYATQVLYRSTGLIPREMYDKISKIRRLFPRDTIGDSKDSQVADYCYKEQDKEVHEWHYLLGCFVRKEIEGHGECNGVVEEIVSPQAASNIGRIPLGRGQTTTKIRECDVKYRVSFPRAEEDMIMSHNDVHKHLFNHRCATLF